MNPSSQLVLPILVVEPNLDHQLVIAYCLRKQIPQAEPVFCSTASVALLYLEQYADDRRRFPCLVLLDSQLPDQGDFLLAELRRQYPYLLLIVLSAFTNTEQVHQAYIAGANSVLLKPTNLPDWEELFQRIETFWFGIAAWPSLN